MTRSNQTESVIGLMPNPSQVRLKATVMSNTNTANAVDIQANAYKCTNRYKYYTHTYKVTKC